MNNTENIVKWLEQCVFEGDTCVSCPYKEHAACKHFLMRDALDLIKNQQNEIKLLQAMGMKMPEQFVLTDKPIYTVES